jgi:hypothetical protein
VCGTSFAALRISLTSSSSSSLDSEEETTASSFLHALAANSRTILAARASGTNTGREQSHSNTRERTVRTNGA